MDLANKEVEDTRFKNPSRNTYIKAGSVAAFLGLGLTVPLFYLIDKNVALAFWFGIAVLYFFETVLESKWGKKNIIIPMLDSKDYQKHLKEESLDRLKATKEKVEE